MTPNNYNEADFEDHIEAHLQAFGYNAQVSTDYDKLRISGTLKYEDILSESFPSEGYTPLTFPGLFP